MFRTRWTLTLALIAALSLTLAVERAHAEPLQSWDRSVRADRRRETAAGPSVQCRDDELLVLDDVSRQWR